MNAAPGTGRLPSAVQRAWLMRGTEQAGGKLPLFDEVGRPIDPRTIRRCIAAGWAERWFDNPLKPDWLVCRLTERGRAVTADAPGATVPRNIKKSKQTIGITLKLVQS